MCGFAIAVTMRRVIASHVRDRSLQCTDATTTSSRSSSSGVLVERAVLEDVDLDAGEQPERRELGVHLVDDVELLAQPLRATGRWPPSASASGR